MRNKTFSFCCSFLYLLQTPKQSSTSTRTQSRVSLDRKEFHHATHSGSDGYKFWLRNGNMTESRKTWPIVLQIKPPFGIRGYSKSRQLWLSWTHFWQIIIGKWNWAKMLKYNIIIIVLKGTYWKELPVDQTGTRRTVEGGGPHHQTPNSRPPLSLTHKRVSGTWANGPPSRV